MEERPLLRKAPTRTIRTEWHRALARYQGKTALLKALPVDHEDGDKAVEDQCAAFDRLVEHTVAPNLHAVIVKLEMARVRYEGFEMPDVTLDAITADLLRIAGEEIRDTEE